MQVRKMREKYPPSASDKVKEINLSNKQTKGQGLIVEKQNK